MTEPTTEPIRSFDHRGPFGFLSNFHPVNVQLCFPTVHSVFIGTSPEDAKYVEDTNVYPSVEHAYQAAKTVVAVQRAGFSVMRVGFTGISAGAAKRLGRSVTMRPDWEDIKLAVMEGLLVQKFWSGLGSDEWTRELAKRLAATAPRELIEGNNWGDVFWGQIQDGFGAGENHLGKLLMKVRDELVRP